MKKNMEMMTHLNNQFFPRVLCQILIIDRKRNPDLDLIQLNYLNPIHNTMPPCHQHQKDFPFRIINVWRKETTISDYNKPHSVVRQKATELVVVMVRINWKYVLFAGEVICLSPQLSPGVSFYQIGLNPIMPH